jgi:hypothetical protein
LEQIKLQSDLGMSHDVQKEGKLEGVEVLIIGSGVTKPGHGKPGPTGPARPSPKMARPVGPKHVVGPGLGRKIWPDNLAGPGLGKKNL